MEIRYKQGAQMKAKPEDAYAEIERIKALCNGDMELQVLVDESKPKDAVLHKEFEWRNTVAARQWRLQQARMVVQSIHIIPDGSDIPVRKYHSVRVVTSEPNKKPVVKNVFRSVEDVMADPETRDELLGQAIRDALAYKKRYQGLQELAKVFAAFDEVLMEIQA
jgi:hypothetical protein